MKFEIRTSLILGWGFGGKCDFRQRGKPGRRVVWALALRAARAQDGWSTAGCCGGLARDGMGSGGEGIGIDRHRADEARQ
eukprot:scaffold19673_cov112-Isochrysis_galbana.AAC.2